MRRATASRWSGYGAVGAGFGVALSWLCCLPFAAALGAGVTAAGAALTPFQPYLAVSSIALLAVALVQTIRSEPCAPSTEETSCRRLSRRGRFLFLAAVTAATLLLLTLPLWSARLIYWTL